MKNPRCIYATITFENKNRYLGKFNSEIEAAIAWDQFVIENKLDRILNFPPPEPESSIPNTKLIRLTKGKFAIIDEEDFERVSEYNWSCKKGYNTLYAETSINRKTIKLHRFVLNIYDSKTQVDHKNHNGLNCMKVNLREATQSQNSMNQQPQVGRFSKYKGVHWNSNNKNFVARIQLNSKRIHIGVFQNEIDAAKAYDLKAKELFGEFAYLNFPEP